MPATGHKPFSIPPLCLSTYMVTRGLTAISLGSQLPAVTRSFSSVSRPQQLVRLAAGSLPELSALRMTTTGKLQQVRSTRVGLQRRGQAGFAVLYLRRTLLRAAA